MTEGGDRTMYRGATLLPDGRVRDATLVFEGVELIEVRPPVAGDPAPVKGLLVPGLVNAHTHLELSWMGPIGGGAGLAGWVRAQADRRRFHTPGPDIRRREAAAGARRLRALGTAAVSDVAAELATADLLLQAGLSGVVQVELIGHDPERTAAGIARAARPPTITRRDGALVVTRTAAHAPYSTSAELVRAALAPGPVPGSLHLAEDGAETAFLTSGEGPFAALLDGFGVSWEGYRPPGQRPVPWLRELGRIGPDTLVIHAVHVPPEDARLLGATRTPVCLCPRSNLWIGGQLPDVPTLLANQVPLCLGTDSLASNDDLDVLGEVVALTDAFPEVPHARWLDAATRGGADALRLGGLGAFRPGHRPGLLHLDTDLDGLAVAAPDRAWRVPPGAPTLQAP